MKTRTVILAAALMLAGAYALPASAAVQYHDRFTAHDTDRRSHDQDDQGNVPPAAVSDPKPTSVPEPVTLALLGAGLAGAGLLGRRRK